MRRPEVFFDGITHIREDLIEEAQRYVFRKRISWRRYAGGLAACLALVLGLSMLFRFGGAGGGAPSGNSSGYDSGAAEGGNGTGAAEPGDRPPEAMESSFTADVAEVLEDGTLLVVPQPGSGVWSVADRVRVPTADVPELPDVQPGDRILVVYTGEAGEDFVEGIVEIRILD